MDIKKEIYTVNNIIEEAEGIVTICLVPENGEMLVFEPGQFVRVDLINNPNNLSSKSYSISSTFKDPFLSISVKKIGPFSGALHDLKVGDKVSLMGPLGSFTVQDFIKKIVFLAGGIGIAPFYSTIKDIYEKGDRDREIYLFYSNKTKKDIAFFEQLQKIEKEWSGLHVIHLLTQEDNKVNGVEEYGRINGETIKKYVSNFNDFNYFVCGAMDFVTETSKIVEDEGVDDGQILAELFY